MMISKGHVIDRCHAGVSIVCICDSAVFRFGACFTLLSPFSHSSPSLRGLLASVELTLAHSN